MGAATAAASAAVQIVEKYSRDAAIGVQDEDPLEVCQSCHESLLDDDGVLLFQTVPLQLNMIPNPF